MSFIEQFENQLVEAGHRRIERRPRNRIARWLRAHPRRRNAAAVLAALAVAGPATAATLGWNPFDDPNRNPRSTTPTLSTTPPARELVQMLAPLRRPQVAADRRAIEGDPSGAFGDDVAGVKLAYIRLLANSVVLVPVDRYGLSVERAAKRDPSIPAPRPGQFANAVCLYVPGTGGTAGRPCYQAAQILSGSAVTDEAGRSTGLVPDGVVRVRLSRDGQTVEVPVRDNLWVADEPPGRSRSVTVEWVDGRGRVTKSVDHPREPAIRR